MSETLTKTIVCRTETSDRKNARLRPLIEEWQECAEYMAAVAMSFKPYQWTAQSTTGYRVMSRKFDDSKNYKDNLMEAQKKVFESFGSWDANGRPGDPPIGDFGDSPYIRIKGDNVTIVENERGYGLKVKIEPYTDPLWLHLDTAPYHESHFDGVVNGNDTTGSAELHLEDSEITAHITVSTDVDMLDPQDAETVVGVDLGENVLYSAAPVDDNGTVHDVEMESGSEFRHYRERISAKYDSLKKQGKLRELKQLQNEREQYTDHKTHVASKRIVQCADTCDNSVIALEDLTGYRNRASAIHDWPFAELQQKITYKATERGIPVVTVDPAYTSQTCRQCGATDSVFRDGASFACDECGYTVHADVNAAINIGQRAWETKVES